MDNHSFIQDIIAYIRTAVRERSVTNLMEARVMQFLLDRLTEVAEMLEAETAARKADAGSLQTALQQKVDAVMQLIRGQGASASARQYPFLDLGNVASQQAVNEVFDSIYQASDDKYNGPMRIARNGALILLSQHVVKALPGEPWHWAQCAAGMITPAADGDSLSAASAFNICVRYTDYQGNATPWRLVSGSGTMQLKTVNGQSLIGEGNITISASGQINIDSQVNPSSNNAVSGAAVAAAIGELAAVIQSLTVDEALSPSSSKPVANAVVTAALQNHSGQIAGLQDEVASLGDVAHQPQVLRFGGFVSSTVNTREESFSGTVDTQNILYYEREKTFVYRSGGLYYLSFPGVGAYKQGGYPVADALYLYNGNAYEWRQNTLSPITGGGSSTPAEVSVDDVTITKKSVGGVDKLALADNAKSSANTLGTVLLTDNVMPEAAANTRYLLYKDINYGNQRRQTLEGMEPLPESISLAPGSKLVPNGGMPKIVDIEGNESPMLVTGGELSWVHSSDIGMVQDDESLSASARQSRGVKNAEILRMVAASRWNLILDGRYYVYIDNSANAVPLWRELHIQGGALVAYRHLFNVMADRPLPDMTAAQLAALRHGGIVCNNVEFIHETSFNMIRLLPSGGVLTKAVFRGCTFKGQGSFIYGENANIIPTDVADIDIKYRYSTERCKTLLGLTENSSGNSRYFLDKNNGYSLYVAAAGSVGEKNRTRMLCLYDLRMPIYVPYAQGEYVFRVSSSGAIKHMGYDGDFILQSDAQQGDTLYQENGAVVYFTTLSVNDTMVNGVITRNANPPVEFQGAQRFIVENCSFLHDPTYTGTKSFGRDIYLDGFTVYDEYLIKGCRFENVIFEAINLCTTNTIETRDEWGGRSCPLVVDGNVFRGYPEVVNGDSTTYYCAIAAEIGTIYFTNNIVERFIGRNPTVYDVYLSCAKVYYQNNLIRNVFPFLVPRDSQVKAGKPITKDMTSDRIFGYMKSKAVKVGLRVTTEESDRKDLTTKPFCRMVENNHFESDIKEVRKICESFLVKYQADFFSLPDLFPDGGYADVPYEEIPLWAIDKVLAKYVMHAGFPNLITYWGLSEYTVRGNVFDLPGVRMHGAAVSSGCAYTGKWTMEDNYFRMKSFVSSRSAGYQYYLFAVGQLSDASTRVSLCRNTFVSDSAEVINLLGLAEGYNLASFRMEDNKFVNCGWRVAQRLRSVGGTEYYEGPIRADEISILRNEEASGLDEGWEINPLTRDGLYFNGWTTSNTSVFGVLGVPHLYIGHGDIELWDSQKNGVAANAPKCVLLPREGKLTVHSKHWCRPMPRYVGATPDTNPSAATGTHIVTAANSSLLEITDITDAEAGVPVTLICGSTASGVHISKSGRFAGITAEWSPAVGNRIRLVKDADGNFTELGRWANTTAQTVGGWANAWDNRALSLVHGLSANEPVSYAVTVRYRLHGRWTEKKLELRSVAVSSNGRGVSARGVDGRRFCNVLSSGTLKTWLLGGIEELGLWFLVSHKYLGDVNDLKNYAAPTLRLDLFTDAHGTKNDIGTEITVETGVITNNADIPTSSALDYGDTSLFETFVPKGSVLTAAERTALLTGDRVFWNVAPTEDGGRTYRTLRPVDAGWWCVDPDSGHVVTWKGTAWSE